ncbi:unnamed protein product [Linum tenue]|uniref:BED-type domain-containing protein n=1 Tax=Linum tenue TaxID=586396 RepID=A0AAV0N7R9_9ROSI|nr:unnamed protein product [Linum tenue]
MMDDASGLVAGVTNEENANIFKRKSGDIGWEYGRLVDPNNKEKVRCNFCGHESTGGINRFKHHIAQDSSKVLKCKKAPPEAKEACLKAFENTSKKKKEKILREQELRDDVIVSSGQQDEEMTCVGSSEPHKLGPMDKWARSIDPKLFSVNLNFNLCFYFTAIPFNAIDNDEFKQMCEAVDQFGPGFVPPTHYDFREPLLKSEYTRTKSLFSDRDDEKMRNGCSIMTDAWTDTKRGSIKEHGHTLC